MILADFWISEIPDKRVDFRVSLGEALFFGLLESALISAGENQSKIAFGVGEGQLFAEATASPCYDYD